MATQTPFKNCILIGVGAIDEHLKCDGDILFATPDNVVLFSEGVLFHNGEQVGFANADVLDAIRDAMLTIYNPSIQRVNNGNTSN